MAAGRCRATVDELAELLAAPFESVEVRRSVHCCLGDIARKPSIEVVAGIANVKEKPATAVHYRARIEQLAAFVPEDRLLVSTSCGCGRVPHDEAIRLNLELVRAAT